jgi:rubredoxin
MLFGNKTRVRPVAGGREIDRYCPECKTVRKFQECDVADNVSVFFVSVADLNSRRMVCPECGEDEEMPPDAAAPPAAPSPPAPAPRRGPTAGELDKMLADLKAKLGK